ncbi:hypothetical protein [Streptomyces sp. 049-1]
MNARTHYAPPTERPWRCRACGNRHSPIAVRCTFTTIPRDFATKEPK